MFVHGNTREACDFLKHAEEFRSRGYLGDALWSITFREGTVDVVAHSLGVTGARYWLAEYDRYDRVDAFVGLAGANHGTSTCPTPTAYPGPANRASSSRRCARTRPGNRSTN